MIDWDRELEGKPYGLNSMANFLFITVSAFYVWLFNRVFKQITKTHYYIVLLLVCVTVYLILLLFSLIYFKFAHWNFDGVFVLWIALMFFGRHYLPIWVEDEVGEDEEHEEEDSKE